MVYYNEHDPFAAAWLRELIAAGHIAFGIVDERSIEDVVPAELMQFKQCHFFAGIGVWSYALRRAGWPDDRPVWTGSCPCQPFSSAGKGDGFADERHLWPAFYHLIEHCRPPVVFGEQVASKAVDDWIDLVHADLEAVGYAFGSVPFPSAGVGAPHIRDRNYWMADLAGQRCGEARQSGARPTERATDGGANVRMADTSSAGSLPGTLSGVHRGEDGAGSRDGEFERPGCAGGLGDTTEQSRERIAGGVSGTEAQEHGERGAIDGRVSVGLEHASAGVVARPGPTNGLWRDADWLFCRDGKWRPVEPGTFPLAHGSPARVGRLRGYGNAVNAEAAIAFIEASMR